MLRTALGPAITGWLEDPTIVEVILNPDGRLWIDRLAGGLADTGERLTAADGERIVLLVAHHVGAEVLSRVSAGFGRTAGNGRAFRGLDPAGRGCAHRRRRRRLVTESIPVACLAQPTVDGYDNLTHPL
jgi:hypothetical protein